MKRTWFNRLLISYIPIFIIAVVLLSALFFIFSNQMTRNQTKKSNDLFMEQALGNLDQMLKQIDQSVLRELNNNEGLNGFYYAAGDDRYNGVALPASKLVNLVSSTPQIDSIYLYRYSDGKVLTGNIIVPYDVFGDAEFIRSIQKNGAPTEWLPVRDYREYAGDPPRSVISLIRKAPILTGEKGLIVINVNVTYISRMIDSMSFSRYSAIRVEDSSGRIMNSSALRNQGNHGPEWASRKSAYTGWVMKIGLLEGGYAFWFSSLYVLWAMITVVMLGFGVYWIIRVSKNHYRPVETILEQVRTSAYLKAAAGKDEFRFIQDAIAQLIDQSNEFEQKHRQDLVYRKQLFFMELLQGNKPIEPEAWKEQMSAFRLPEQHEGLQLAVVEVDKYPQFCQQYNQRDQALLKFALKSVLSEIAAKHEISIWAEWIESDRLGVLRFLQQPEEGRPSPAYCEELHLWVRDHLHFTVTIGLSSVIAHAEDIPLAFEEADTALKYKTVLGLSRVIHVLDVKPRGDIDVYNRLQAVRSIVVMYKQGNEEWRSSFRQLIDHLQDEHAVRDDVLITLNYFNYQLNQAMKEFSAGYKQHWENQAYPRFIKLLEQYELLSELSDHYLERLNEEFERILHIRESSSNRSLIRQIQTFIEAHLANPDLSLNMIGDTFKLNDKQVSQLIKEELGEKFVEYLARLRIQHAKQLLVDTEESIQSISLQVGYVHSLSFIRMFKKMMHMTPGDYRKVNRAR